VEPKGGVYFLTGAYFEVKKQKMLYTWNKCFTWSSSWSPEKKCHKCTVVYVQPLAFEKGGEGITMGNKRISAKQWHLKGLEPINLRESIKQLKSIIVTCEYCKTFDVLHLSKAFNLLILNFCGRSKQVLPSHWEKWDGKKCRWKIKALVHMEKGLTSHYLVFALLGLCYLSC
jgi:hypothetical protein